MAFRSVIITEPAILKINNNRLSIQKDETVFIPLEDIAVIIIEERQVTLSSALLAALAENGIALYVCDNYHLPNAVMLPFLPHSRQSGVARLQVNLSVPLKKRLWQKIVKSKINNQALCLEYLGIKGVKRLKALAQRVKSGDSENVESVAAAIYFENLFPHKTRRDEDAVNSALNYGYAIIRGAVARALVAHGFYPPLGLHHHSELNEYNLADDIIEPFRQFVDIWVAKYPPAEEKLSKLERAALVSILHLDCKIGDQIYSLLTAVEITAASLITAIKERDTSKLKLPVLCIPKVHKYE